MQLLNPEIEHYLASLQPPRPEVVVEMETRAERERFPIIGSLCGALLDVLTRTSNAQRVFELGSGFGYSSYWFLRAMGPSGSLVHTDFSAELSSQARGYLGRLGLAGQASFEVGDAVSLLSRHEGPFDIIFCDIDKEAYPQVPELAVPRLRMGGLLIFDNTLWSGRVVNEDARDAASRGVRELNRILHERDDLRTVIVPLRDGVSVSTRVA